MGSGIRANTSLDLPEEPIGDVDRIPASMPVPQVFDSQPSHLPIVHSDLSHNSTRMPICTDSALNGTVAFMDQSCAILLFRFRSPESAENMIFLPYRPKDNCFGL